MLIRAFRALTPRTWPARREVLVTALMVWGIATAVPALDLPAWLSVPNALSVFFLGMQLVKRGFANPWRDYAELWRELAYEATGEPEDPAPLPRSLAPDPQEEEVHRLLTYLSARSALRARARELELRRPGGRRKGSGAFRSREHFLEVTRAAVRDIAAHGGTPTQEAVSKWLEGHDHVPTVAPRTLKAKTRDFGFPSWEALLAEVQ